MLSTVGHNLQSEKNINPFAVHLVLKLCSWKTAAHFCTGRRMTPWFKSEFCTFWCLAKILMIIFLRSSPCFRGYSLKSKINDTSCHGTNSFASHAEVDRREHRQGSSFYSSFYSSHAGVDREHNKFLLQPK